MTIFALIEGGAVAAYPYSVAQLRSANPDTSFPAEIPDERLADYGMFPVTVTAPPVLSPGEVAEEAPPELVDGAWRQMWTVRAGSVDEFMAAKAAKWTAAKVRRDESVDGGCAAAGIGSFETDPLSRSNINGAVTGALIAQGLGQPFTGALIAQGLGQPFTVDWKLQDNSIASLDGTQMIAVGMAVMTHVAACHANAQALGLAIEAAADFAALDAIDIGAGWP